jgi:hypothetical protein
MESRALLTAALLCLAACGQHEPAAQEPSVPALLIDRRGVTMPLGEAVTDIAYRPWLPPGRVLKYAVIPPLGNDDTPRNRGIAVEYESSGRALLLSEWPKQNFSLLFLRNVDIAHVPCKVVHYKPNGLAWTTHGNLAMTLQPDGDLDSGTLSAEAQHLIAAGACD